MMRPGRTDSSTVHSRGLSLASSPPTAAVWVKIQIGFAQTCAMGLELAAQRALCRSHPLAVQVPQTATHAGGARQTCLTDIRRRPTPNAASRRSLWHQRQTSRVPSIAPCIYYISELRYPGWILSSAAVCPIITAALVDDSNARAPTSSIPTNSRLTSPCPPCRRPLRPQPPLHNKGLKSGCPSMLAYAATT